MINEAHHAVPDHDTTLGAPADRPDPDSQLRLRDCVVRLAFGGDPARFDEFIRVLRDATPAGVDVILRGSAVTGHKWGSEEPFDSEGPGTSDLDVTFVGGNMVMLFDKFHILGIHSVPLSKQHPDASPALVPLRDRLCKMTHRAVNLQATTSLVQYLRDVVMDQPYLVLVQKSDSSDASNASNASNARTSGR
jgi:hypothetical protein